MPDLLSRLMGLALAAGLMAGCGEAGFVERPIREIAVPTEADREAGHKLAEARRLFEADEPAKAEPLLREVLAARPDESVAWQLLGRILVGGRRRPEGIAALEKALAIDPADVEARDLLIRAHYHDGEFTLAARIAEEWAAQDPEAEQALFRLGQALYAQGKLKAARQSLRRAARLRHSRADIRSELGLVEQALGALPQAEAAQRDALERDPKLATAWFRLGTVLSQDDVSRAEEALEAFDRALAEEPDLINAHLYRYRLLVLRDAEGDAALARKSWKKVLATHARKQLTWYGLGTRPKKNRKPRAYERELVRTAVATPDDPAPRAELAALLHGEGHLPDALEWYAKWIALAPTDADAHAGRGAALLWDHHFEQAEPALREALRLQPDHPTAQRHVAWLLLSAGRAAEAVTEYSAILERTPDDVLAQKGRALALMASGQVEEGLRAIAAAGWL